MATGKSKRTAFIVAGHHPEYSGPEAAYQVAERLLIAHYEDKNPNVIKMRRNTHFTIIPQVNVDLYNNMQKYNSSPVEYWQEGFGLPGHGDSHAYNYYGSKSEYLSFYNRFPPKEPAAVKKTVEDTIAKYGRPFLVLDYHENDIVSYSMIKQIGLIPLSTKESSALASYVFVYGDNGSLGSGLPYTEVVVTSPEHASREMALVSSGKVRLAEEDRVDCRRDTFSELTASLGADSFVFEIEGGLSLEEKISKILAGTDRILAQYFLGI